MSKEIIRVLRVLEYVGPRDVVEKQLRQGGVPANGEHVVAGLNLTIKSALVGTFGDVVSIENDNQNAKQTTAN
ncbi:MAG TPA: hypothetical protein VGL77_02085 [Armatimonadota bacterium]|jgi:hypothetical protein